MRLWVMLLAVQPLLWAGGSYTGPQACRSCHLKIYNAQSNSRHLRALRPIGETPLAGLLTGVPIRERNGVSFDYELAGSSPRVVVTRGSSRIEAALTWAFGAGAQAYTPVGLYEGRFFEHRVSYYTSAMRPGRTLGHPGAASSSLKNALGLFQDAKTIERCFDCHATAVRPGPDLKGAMPGISCERCHGAGGAHVVSRAAVDITRLSHLNASQSVAFCAQCHRAPSPDAPLASQLHDPMSIRFQPLGLMASRCFRESRVLSCVTCHDPHEDASHDAAHYTRKCLNCHANVSAANSKCERAARKNCLPCHMQRSSPAEFLTFTDHRIRVYP